MTKAFWVIAAGWVLGVILSAPAAFEGADGNGIGLTVPGLSASASEFVITMLIALGPPLLAAVLISSRRKRR